MVSDDGVDLSDSEVDSLGEFVLVVDLHPPLDVLGWLVLDVPRDLQLSEPLLLHDEVVLGCLRWLSELSPVRSLLGHLPKCLLGCSRVEILVGLHREDVFVQDLLDVDVALELLESLVALDIENSLDHSQALRPNSNYRRGHLLFCFGR